MIPLAFALLIGGSVAAWVIFARQRPKEKCLHGVNTHAMMTRMDINSTDRLVLVPATQLDDLLELTRHLVDRLPESDPLRWSLLGATSAVRAAATAEP